MPRPTRFWFLVAWMSRSVAWAAGSPDGGLVVRFDANELAKQVTELMRRERPKGPGPDEVRKKISELRRQAASPAERALIDRMVALFDWLESDAGTEDLDAIIKDYAQLIRDLSALTPDNEKTQLEMVRDFAHITLMTEQQRHGPLHLELGQRLDELVRRFPRSGRVYRARASYSFQLGRSELDTLRDLGRCARLAPAECAQRFQEAARDYESPVCGKPELDPGLKVFAERNGGEVKSVEGKKVAIAAAPFLTTADIDEVISWTGDSTQTLEDGGTVTRQVTICELKLNPSAHGRLAQALQEMKEVSATNLDSGGWHAGQPVFWLDGAPWLLGDSQFTRYSMPEGSLALPSPELGPSCMRICKRTHLRRLPADLDAP